MNADLYSGVCTRDPREMFHREGCSMGLSGGMVAPTSVPPSAAPSAPGTSSTRSCILPTNQRRNKGPPNGIWNVLPAVVPEGSDVTVRGLGIHHVIVEHYSSPRCVLGLVVPHVMRDEVKVT
jgi:hypothetical protein